MSNSSSELKNGHTHTFIKYIDGGAPARYAEASGDRNPLHLDPSAAAERGLGGNVLHGMCSLAFMLSGLMQFVGESAFVKSVDLRFSRPVYPGGVVSFRYFLESVEDGELDFSVSARDRDGLEVLRNTRVLVVFGLAAAKAAT